MLLLPKKFFFFRVMIVSIGISSCGFVDDSGVIVPELIAGRIIEEEKSGRKRALKNSHHNLLQLLELGHAES